MAIDELNEYKQQVESGRRNSKSSPVLYSDDPAARKKAAPSNLSRSDSKSGIRIFATAFASKKARCPQS